MELLLKKGIGNLFFGMSREQVQEILGQPDNESISGKNDSELILEWKKQHFKLHFLQNEGGRLAYFVVNNPHLTHGNELIIGKTMRVVSREFSIKIGGEWETARSGSWQTLSNQAERLVIGADNGEVVQVELGVPLDMDGNEIWP